MIVKLSRKIAILLCKHGVVPDEDFEVYCYSFEILLSTVLNTLLILVVAVITNTFFKSFAFAACFFHLRRLCGGVHAKTHFVCISSMMVIYVAFLISSPQISINLLGVILLSCAEITIVFLLAPVEDFNKPLLDSERIEYGKQSRMFTIFVVTLSLVLFLLNYPTLAVAVQFSLVSVCALLILGKISNLITVSRVGS